MKPEDELTNKYWSKIKQVINNNDTILTFIKNKEGYEND